MPASSSSACPPAPPRNSGRSVADPRQPLGHRAPVHHPGPLALGADLPDPPGSAESVSHATLAARLDDRNHAAGRPQHALAPVDAEVPLALPQPAALQGDHPHELRAPVRHPADVAEQRPHPLGRRVASRSRPRLTVGAQWAPVAPVAHGRQVGSGQRVRSAECGRRWPGRAMARPHRSITLCSCVLARGPRSGCSSSPAPRGAAVAQTRSSPRVRRTRAQVLPGPVQYTFEADRSGPTPSSAPSTAARSRRAPALRPTTSRSAATSSRSAPNSGAAPDATPASATWIVRNVPCEQASAGLRRLPRPRSSVQATKKGYGEGEAASRPRTRRPPAGRSAEVQGQEDQEGRRKTAPAEALMARSTRRSSDAVCL